MPLRRRAPLSRMLCRVPPRTLIVRLTTVRPPRRSSTRAIRAPAGTANVARIPLRRAARSETRERVTRRAARSGVSGAADGRWALGAGRVAPPTGAEAAGPFESESGEPAICDAAPVPTSGTVNSAVAVSAPSLSPPSADAGIVADQAVPTRVDASGAG